MNAARTDQTAAAILELRDRLIERNGEAADPSAHLDFALLELELSRAGFAQAQPVQAFQRAVHAVRQSAGMPGWLFGGASGLGWLVARFSRSLGIEVAGTDVVDHVVAELLADLPVEVDTDLPQGPLGLAVYGVAHPDPVAGGRIVDQVLDVIESRSARDADGIFWRLTHRELRAQLNPDSIGQADLGVAHGQAGVIGLLSSVVRSRVGNTERATRLLRESTAWLLAQRNTDAPSHFGHVAGDDHGRSRDAWCYGDPGISLVLYQAARALDDRDIFAVARSVAQTVLRRPAESSEVVDCSLCHGSSFLAFIGHQLRWFDAELDIDAFADHWREEVLAAIDAGPLTYPIPAGGRGELPHFLEGDVGVALALLTTVSRVRPIWTDLLLADFVPSASQFGASEAARYQAPLLQAV